MSARPRILVLSTGGTIVQHVVDGKMEASVPIASLAADLDVEAELEFRSASAVSGAAMTFEILLLLRDQVLQARQEGYAGVIVTTGTDSLEEMAFALDLLLPPAGPVVFTGAMRPTSALGYDGAANLRNAVQTVLAPEAAELGVLVTMSGVIHAARYLRKQDSAMLDAFQSHPGPIADIRRGRAQFYYTALPELTRYLKPDPTRLAQVNVGLWAMTLQGRIPEAYLEALDGLVVAGMGTGSLSAEVLDQLSPRWTGRMPVVLVTRCATGGNYDDHLYKGSLAKYEGRGFRLQGFEGLNGFQARLKLMLEVAVGEG